MEAYKCELNKGKLCGSRRNKAWRSPFSGKTEDAPYCLNAGKFIEDMSMGCPEDSSQQPTEQNEKGGTA
jgi:hypothetical protein